MEIRVIIFKLLSDIPFDLSFVRRYELSIQHPLINHARFVARNKLLLFLSFIMRRIMWKRETKSSDLFLVWRVYSFLSFRNRYTEKGIW